MPPDQYANLKLHWEKMPTYCPQPTEPHRPNAPKWSINIDCDSHNSNETYKKVTAFQSTNYSNHPIKICFLLTAHSIWHYSKGYPPLP